MKTTRTKKVEVYQSCSAGEFQDMINEAFARLGECGIKFEEELFNNSNGFSAFIKYEMVEKFPECLKDEYELKGITFRCKDCDFYTPLNSYEGSCPRIKRGRPLANDDVGNCSAFWERMEEKEAGKMFEELRREIKSQYKTIYKFCEKIELHHGFFSTKLNGGARFTMDDRVRIIRGLGYELSEETLARFFPEEKEDK